MLILFDQGTPVGIRDSLPQHTVKTAREMGWSALLQLLRYRQPLHPPPKATASHSPRACFQRARSTCQVASNSIMTAM